MVLLILYIIGVLYGLFIVFLFLNQAITINSAILSAFGIMISAFIASFSVRESILNTNRLEVEKVKRELFDRRKKVVFLLRELFIKLIDTHNSTELIIEKVFLEECNNILADSQYIFDKLDYKQIEIFHNIIHNLISLINMVENIDKMNFPNKESEINRNLNKIYQSQEVLLESLHENLKFLEKSIQLT